MGSSIVSCFLVLTCAVFRVGRDRANRCCLWAGVPRKFDARLYTRGARGTVKYFLGIRPPQGALFVRYLPLTSLANPRIKHAARLHEGGYRRQQGQFVIDGLREIRAAKAGGIQFVELFCDVDSRDSIAERAPELEALDVTLWVLPRSAFEKLTFGQRHSELVAVARTPDRRIEDLRLPVSAALVAVLEGVEKPGNTGAVIRSADAAGVSAVVLADAGTDPFNPNTIRASLGTVFSVPVAVAEGAAVAAWLKESGLRTYIARADATRLYSDIDWREPAAVVFGSEDRGASNRWHAIGCEAIRLPMHGQADSLNVSVTAAVVFYEALRQRAGRVGEKSESPRRHRGHGEK